MHRNNSEKPVILVLANSSGGLYEFRRELLEALADDYRIVASLPDDTRVEQLRPLGVEIVRTEINRHGINPVQDMSLFLSYLRLIKQTKPSVVLTYTIKPNVYGGMACSIMGVKYLANITGLGQALESRGPVGLVAVALYRLGLGKAFRVFVQNESNRKFALEKGFAKQENLVLLPGSGVNLESFCPYPMPEIPGFVFISRVMKSKGIEEYLDTAVRITGELKPEEPMFTVLGDTEEEYGDLLKEYSDRGIIRYPGKVPDVRPYLEGVQCLIHPSFYSEGMSNVCLEAASSGRVVITTDHPGCRETVVDGVSGYLVKPRDKESLYEAVKRFLAMPMQGRQEMGMAGRRHMEECFDRKKVVEEYLKVINTE